MIKVYNAMMEFYANLKEQVRLTAPHDFEQWKAGGFLIDPDVLSMYPSLGQIIEKLAVPQAHAITYPPDNCEWWSDILDGLRDEVPGSQEFASVEVTFGPPTSEAEHLATLAAGNGWDYLDLAALFQYRHDELNPEDKSVAGIIDRAIEHGDDVEWIREMVTEPARK